MRVPHQVAGRTRPSGQGLDYHRVDTSGVVAAFSDVFSRVAGLGEAIDARQNKAAEYDALRKFTDFEIRTDAEVAKIQRDTVPGDQTLMKRTEEVYTKLENDFIATLPPEYQDPYRTRAAQVKQRVAGATLDFNFKQLDVAERKGVTDTVDAARKSLEVSSRPEDLEAWNRRVTEQIEKSSLSEPEKFKLKQDTTIALTNVAYQNAMRKAKLEEKKSRVNFGEGDALQKTTAALKHFEGFRTKAYWDKNGYRVGYGSDTYMTEDGKVHRVTQNTVITAADAERDLARRIPEFQSDVEKAIGSESWNKLDDNAKAALTSVMYNYGAGNFPKTVVAAAQSGDTGALAIAVGNLSANRDRRRTEAQMIAGNVAELKVNADPQFAAVPYEDRIAIAKDADTEVTQYLSQQATLAKQQQAAQVDDLLMSIYKGTSGRKDAEDFMGTTPDLDYGDVQKIEAALKRKEDGVADLAYATGKLASASIWDPTDEKDKKGLNALYAPLDSRVEAGDQAAFKDALTFVNKTQDIPTDLIGTLSGMSRHKSATLANYAFDALSQLREAAPVAFEERTTDELASTVDFWSKSKNRLSPEELLSGTRGGLTTEQRQSQVQLLEAAQKTLTNKNDPNFVNFDDVRKRLLSRGLVRSPAELSAIPWASRGLERDFHTRYTDEYVRYSGDAKMATEAAIKSLERDWGVSGLGGANLLMKHPPAKAGYSNLPDEELDKQVRSQFKLGPDDKYQLLSDELTEAGIAAMRAGKATGPISYAVVTFDEAGVPRYDREKNRISFVMTPEFKAKTEATHEMKAGEIEYDNWYRQVYVPAQQENFIKEPALRSDLEAEKQMREDKLAKQKSKVDSFKVPVKMKAVGGKGGAVYVPVE